MRRQATVDSKQAVLVVGAGDATGSAIARRFAAKGLIACVTRRTADKLEPLVEQIRSAGGQAHGFAADARVEADLAALVARIESEIASLVVDGAIDTAFIADNVRAARLTAAGFDAAAFAAHVADPAGSARLVATIEEAVARGVFGAPTFFVGEEMFFVQDRLEFVREALLA